MRKSMFRPRLTICVIVLFICCSSIELYSQGFSPATTSRLQAVIDSFQNNPANPYIGGMSAAIQVDGLASWNGATGYASRNIDGSNNLLPGGTTFTTGMLSRAYSVTKTFTAALVLELANEGVISLDDGITHYVPLSLINPQLDPNVSIRQLLAHESGYSDFTDEINLQISVAFQPTRSWAPYEVVSFAHQENPPGLPRKYSSTNYILLGMIIEAATGKPVEQLFRERFLTPLHLNSMYLAGREPIGSHGTLVAPHDNISALNPVFQLTGQPTFPDAITNIRVLPFNAIETISYTSGGIVSSASDLAEWGTRLFGGDATSSSTLQQMVQSISPTPDGDGDYLGYGLWRTTKISSTDVFIGHDGNATGYRSVMFYQPDKKLTIAIVTNFHGAKLYDVARALYESLPAFSCGNNGNPDKVIICRNGKAQCIARPAAINAIKNGAYLGPCSGQANTNHANAKEDNTTGSAVQKQKQALQVETSNPATLDAFPNPFKQSVQLNFTTPVAGKVVLEIFSSNGMKLKTLYNGFMNRNSPRQLTFEKAGFPAGIYFVRLTTPKGAYEQKLILSQ